MEETGKDVQVASASSGKSKLRYQLRSSIKSKDEKPSPMAGSMSSATKRVRPTPGVSKSMNVLDLSGKDKSAKPPRRLSIPTKTSVTPAGRRIDSMTPISETRSRRLAMGQAISDTPSSEASKSGISRSYNRISTASYWLSQIKLAETADKHSISLGFFKLAFEAGCEPKQQIRNELKAYARKHKLEEHGSLVNEIFGTYNITEKLEDLRATDNASEIVQGSNKSSDEDAQIATSSVRGRNYQPKSLNNDVLNNDVARAYTTARSIIKEFVQRKSLVAKTTRGSVARTFVTMKRAPGNTAQKNTDEAAMKKSSQEKIKIIKKDAKSTNIEDNLGSVTETGDEEKENMGSTMVVEELATATVGGM